MKTYLDCIPCFLTQTLSAARIVTDDEEIQAQLLKEVASWCSQIDYTLSPPLMGQKIHQMIRKVVNNPDPYKQLKDKYNNYILGMYDHLKEEITTAKDPLETAIRMAAAGNIIDFGVNAVISEASIDATIKKCYAAPFDQNTIDQFKEEIKKAKKILYLGDNAGEIVFDRLLIEQMLTEIDAEKLTFAVRGFPVLNDITREDAEAVGITKLVKVIDNGIDIPGTDIEQCSEEFKKAYYEADLIIAKGQGNFETLNNAEKNIYFIFMVKCGVISSHTGLKKGTLVFKHTDDSFKF